MITDGPVTGRLRELTVDGVRLAVREWGDPDGDPVLFWHPLGTVTSGAWLTELAPTLADDHGLHLVAVDGPGFGLSPGVPRDRTEATFAVPRLAGLAWGVVDALELDQPVLMGHSWGGVVVTCAAAARPSDVAALVLLDSGHVDYGDDPRSMPDLSLDDREAQVAEHAEVWRDRAALHADVAADVRRPVTDLLLAALEPAVRERPDGSLVPVVDARTVAAARHGMVRERSSSRWPALAGGDVPVLLLLATEPPEARERNTTAAARMQEAVPGLDARFTAGWGHDLIADGGPALATELGEWLSVNQRRR